MAQGMGKSRAGLLRHNLQFGERSSGHGARHCGETQRQMSEPDEEWLHEAGCREPNQTTLNEPQQPKVGEVSACVALEMIEIFSEGISLPLESQDTQLTRKRSLTREGVGPSKRKGRGPAIGMGKPDKDYKPIINFLNGRPVSNNRDCFITKIGIWAKDQSRFPFKTQNFDRLPEAEWERLEDDLNDYFDIRYQGDLRKLIKQTCRRIWNDERSKLYRRNYACHATHEDALRHPPKGMNPDTWRTICEDVFLGENWKRYYETANVTRSGAPTSLTRELELIAVIAGQSIVPPLPTIISEHCASSPNYNFSELQSDPSSYATQGRPDKLRTKGRNFA